MVKKESPLLPEQGAQVPRKPHGSLRVFLVAWIVLAVAVVRCAAFFLGADGSTAPMEALLAGLAEMAAIAVAVALVVHVGFRPTIQLGDSLQLRRTTDLTPIEGTHAIEVQRLVDAINSLVAAQQESIERQRRFLADASHQLRTPFAVLKTQIQGLMSQQLDARATLPKMLSTVDKSSDLLRQLLAIEKVEQLRKAANWVEVDVATVVRDVVVEMSPIVARKQLDLSLESTKVVIETDPWLLAELIKNLLSNAIHHSTKGASLGVLVRELPSAYELIVWDNGGGVNAEIQARLFEPFASASGTNGVGLGLSICKQIATSMNAEVGLYNRVGDGRIVGADAVVRWPKSALGQQPVEANALDQYLGNQAEAGSPFWKGADSPLVHGEPSHE